MSSFDPFADFRMDGHSAIVTGSAQNIGERVRWNCVGRNAEGGSANCIGGELVDRPSGIRPTN
jgi:hypothetical protein